jgi:NADH-quinone oxidoreductase subunit J
MEAFAFYLFGGVALLSAIGILVSRNIIRTAVCLLGTLGGVGCLYFVLDASFLAAIQFIVYVGGTLILIIFGVMLTTQSPWVTFTSTRAQVVAGCVVAVLLAFGLCMLLLHADWPQIHKEFTAPPVREIGNALLTDYLLPFEAASVLLLVVMIGAAYLARGEK